MLVYLEIRNMTFEDNIEHQIILRASKEDFSGCDETIETEFELEETENGEHFITREQKTWFSFPLYELRNSKIRNFDYTKYQYFADSDRREMLVGKISDLYHPSSESKIIRKTLKTILDHLEITDEGFEKYNTKIEELISKNPKN